MEAPNRPDTPVEKALGTLMAIPIIVLGTITFLGLPALVIYLVLT